MPKSIIESEIIDKLSQEADELILSNSHEDLKKFLEPYLEVEYSFESLYDEARYYYVLGNCSATLYNYRRLEWFSDKLSKGVIFYRKALNAAKKINSPSEMEVYLISCIETNLGNALSSQGRAFCSIPLWDNAIKCKQNPVPIISKANNELFIASSIYDPSHKECHYFFAYKLIQLGLEHLDKLYPEQRAAYSEDSILMDFKSWFEDNFETENFSYLEAYKFDFDSDKQAAYLKWCADKRLFINDLNDISASEIVYQDIITLPSISRQINPTLQSHEELAYHGNFDELKNDYCYARYLFFVAKDIPNEQNHLFNTTYPHVNDFAHTVTNLKASHYKSSFKTLYSLFDKIAYFLHRFFDLNIIKYDHRINFDLIFREIKNTNKWIPNPKLKDSSNHFIHALFYILKDIRDVKDSTPVSLWLDPDAKAFCDIRNAIEHRSLKIIDDFGCESIQADKGYEQQALDTLITEIDDIKEEIENLNDKIILADKEQNSALKTKLESNKLLFDKELQEKQKLYEKQKLSSHSLLIAISEFETRLMTLMRLVRNSIMYLSLAIHFEEQKKTDDDAFVISKDVPLK